MTKYPEFQRSSSLTVDLEFADACRNVVMNLLTEIHVFVRSYAERFGKTPDVAVVLASTDLAAALAIVAGMRPDEIPLWRYERDTGQLYLAGSSVMTLVCEHPAQEKWACEITAPGALTLGDALIHKATITAVRP